MAFYFITNALACNSLFYPHYRAALSAKPHVMLLSREIQLARFAQINSPKIYCLGFAGPGQLLLLFTLS